ncbi:hypothetical protein MMC28_007481 [Mycoblastus sanguinarius]|nr:hypothetical protein [Mycoblastus sanguinarius]
MVVAIVLYGTTSDRYIKYKQSTEGIMKPKYRLPSMLVGAIVLPIGFFLYGWTAAKQVQWIAPLAGTAMIGFSVILTILPTENYLVDSYDLYSASAIAAGVILRAFAGAVIPLMGPPLYSSLGLGWGNSVLGFIALAFIPAIVLLIRYGERIRKSPRFHRDL